jgi:hypothetical protein
MFALLHTVPFVSAKAAFPAMHFGCNASGPESLAQIAKDVKYSTIVIEFRHEMLVKPWNHEEEVLRDQAVEIDRFAASKGLQTPTIYVYRNAHAGSMFETQASAIFDPQYSILFSGPPRTDPTLNISWRSFNFSEPAAVEFYIETIVAEAAGEPVSDKTALFLVLVIFAAV